MEPLWTAVQCPRLRTIKSSTLSHVRVMGFIRMTSFKSSPLIPSLPPMTYKYPSSRISIEWAVTGLCNCNWGDFMNVPAAPSKYVTSDEASPELFEPPTTTMVLSSSCISIDAWLIRAFGYNDGSTWKDRECGFGCWWPSADCMTMLLVTIAEPISKNKGENVHQIVDRRINEWRVESVYIFSVCLAVECLLTKYVPCARTTPPQQVISAVDRTPSFISFHITSDHRYYIYQQYSHLSICIYQLTFTEWPYIYQYTARSNCKCPE